MKQAALTVLILLCLTQVSSTLNVILASRIREARLICEKTYGSDIMTQIRQEVTVTKEIPNREKYNCFFACWMTELRQLKNGTLDVEEIIRVTKEEMKGNLINFDEISNVIRTCAVRKGDIPKNECDLVHQYMKCVHEEIEKLWSKTCNDSNKI